MGEARVTKSIRRETPSEMIERLIRDHTTMELDAALAFEQVVQALRTEIASDEISARRVAASLLEWLEEIAEREIERDAERRGL